MSFAISNICTSHRSKTIGTKVTKPEEFWKVVNAAITVHDFTKDETPGQGFIMVPEATPFISAGVGRRTTNQDHYHCREHRGVVSAYLKREHAEPATGCAVIVYTIEAYAADPEVDAAELAEFRKLEYEHVLVAVLGFAGPKSQLSPHRLVSNLAGGNNNALAWSADRIREEAKASIEYDNEWCVVAD